MKLSELINKFDKLDKEDVANGKQVLTPDQAFIFRDVFKRYNTSDRYGVLDAKSGSGKTTISSLLPRFYEIEQGEILLDGVNTKDCTLASLRKQIAVVSQQVVLFNDTIANNISYGYQGELTAERLLDVAEKAHVMEFASQMPLGLDTQIGENGVTLSGGQRQRIAIARALLRQSPILVLDEATSALDTESERKIQAALDELLKNRTT
jgi:subfamily B ATP-binding cassette protein MsbA